MAAIENPACVSAPKDLFNAGQMLTDLIVEGTVKEVVDNTAAITPQILCQATVR